MFKVKIKNNKKNIRPKKFKLKKYYRIQICRNTITILI